MLIRDRVSVHAALASVEWLGCNPRAPRTPARGRAGSGGRLCRRRQTCGVTWATRPLAVGSPPVLRVAVLPTRPTCGAECRCRQVARLPAGKSGWSVCACIWVAELAQSGSAEQTRPMSYTSWSAVAESGQFASVPYGIAAFNICLPAPNHSIERTSQSPLRALCAAAHVKR